MYKGFQEKMFQNPWGVNEGFKHLQEKLDELLPMMGRCEFPNSKNKTPPMTFSIMVLVTREAFSKTSTVGLLVLEIQVMRLR